MKWPIREGLLAYLDKLKADATEDYRMNMILYALGASKEKPKLPQILK